MVSPVEAEEFKTLTKVSLALTDERLSSSLSDWFREDVKFTHWEYVSGTGKGDSYLSEMMSIRIYGVNKNNISKHVQVFLKTIPKSICRRLSYRIDDFFKNEISFYKNVLPELLKFQASKNMRDPYKGDVKMFLGHYDGTHGVICLEDASLENYCSLVRQEGTDIDHCKAAFKSLAQFHAISYAMKDQQPEEFNKIRTAISEIYYDDHLWDWYKDFWILICQIAIDAVEKEFPNSIYERKIKEFAVPERYKDMIKAVRDTYEIGVISHGDTWINNFLYKYENNKPVHTKIIDFQLARCGSPVLDLTFFIYSCTSQEMRLKYYDELLAHYYEVLSTQIRDMGSDPNKVYSWTTFMEEMKYYSYFGLGFSFESTPLTLLSDDDCFDMDLEGDQKRNITDFWKIKPFKTKEGRLREANNVVFCVDRGYI